MITVLASLFRVTLTTLLGHQQLVDWGWRIPYFFGMLGKEKLLCVSTLRHHRPGLE